MSLVFPNRTNLAAGAVSVPLRLGPLPTTDRSNAMMAPGVVVCQTWLTPAAKATTGFLTATTGASLPAAAGSVTLLPNGSLGAGAQAHARNVVITVTHASSVVAASGVITGRDRYGATITEAWSVTATGTTKTFTGAVAFYAVTSITYVTAANATANTIIAGNGDVFGLNFAHPITSPLKEYSAGSLVTNGVFVAASAAANADRRGTYAPNTIPNGATTYTVYLICMDAAAI